MRHNFLYVCSSISLPGTNKPFVVLFRHLYKERNEEFLSEDDFFAGSLHFDVADLRIYFREMRLVMKILPAKFKVSSKKELFARLGNGFHSM